MTRAEIILTATARLAQLVEEHGNPNRYLASEVAGGALYPMHVGRYGREIAGLYQDRTGRKTTFDRKNDVSYFEVEA